MHTGLVVQAACTGRGVHHDETLGQVCGIQQIHFICCNQFLIQCIRSGSGSNEVPRSVSGSGFAIRIRIQEGKKDQKGPTNVEKKLINFIF
jgi:hypothetical protein